MAAATALAGILVSNWNSIILTLILWGITVGGLALGRNWKPLLQWTAALVLALWITDPFWWPALQLLPTVRPPNSRRATAVGVFLHRGVRPRQLWIQASLIAILLASRWLGWGWRSDWLGKWDLDVTLLPLMLILPLSQPIYGLLTPLQRIQFPSRWLRPAWVGSLLWLGSAALLPVPSAATSHWRRFGLGLALLGCWFDAVWRFRSRVLGHAPSVQERAALRQLLNCEPLRPCPEG